MKNFEETVGKILKTTPPKTGFGAKHFKAGLDPEYNGPKYGKSTIADAYFEAGKRSRNK